MDRKLIEQYGEDILSYRLRTARQKKRMQYEDFDKQLLRQWRELNSLHKKKKDLGWEPLVPPVQKGWKRCFVLREDVAHSKQAEFYEHLLKKINTYDWSHRRDFKVKQRRFGRKKYVVKGQKLLKLYTWDFEGVQFTEAEKQLFDEVYDIDKKGNLSKRYVFNEPWRFVLRVRPNMIDRIRKRDSQLEARISEIDDHLEWNVHYRRLHKILCGEGRYKYWKVKEEENIFEKYVFKNKSFSQIMDLISET